MCSDKYLAAVSSTPMGANEYAVNIRTLYVEADHYLYIHLIEN